MLVLQIGLLVWMVVVLVIFFSRQADARRTWRTFLKDAKPVRQLQPAERDAIQAAFKRVTVASDDVYLLQGDAGVQGLRSSRGNDLHVIVAGVEIKPFPQWALYTQAVNHVEVVRARHGGVAIPVSFNGLSLADALERKREGKGVDFKLVQAQAGEAPVQVIEQKDERAPDAPARVCGDRDELPREAVLRNTTPFNNVGMVLLLCLGLALLLIASLMPGAWQWLGLVGVVPVAYAAFRLAREWKAPRPGAPIVLRTLEGPLGLRQIVRGKDNDPTLVTQACVGSTPVTYPPGWQAVFRDNPQGDHRVTIDERNNVVQFDRLSVYELRERYPIPRWGRYLAMLVGGVSLALAAWIHGGAPVSSLQMAVARVDGHARNLVLDSPQALVQARPAPGDWLSLSGQAQCFGAAAGDDVEIARHVARGEPFVCHTLGWVGGTGGDATVIAAVGQSDWQLPKPMLDLTVLAGTLAPPDDASSPDDGAADARIAALQAEGQALLQQLALQKTVDLNDLVGAVDGVCVDNDVPCAVLEVDVRQLVDGDGAQGSWTETVKQAKAGKLPRQAVVATGQAETLSDAIVEAMAPRVRKLELGLLAALRSHDKPDVYLMPRPNGYAVAQGSAVIPALATQSARNLMLVPALGMMHVPFTLRGEVGPVTRRDGRLALGLAVADAPPSLFALATAPLILMLALVLAALGALGLAVSLPVRERMRRAEAEYISSNLGR